MDDMNNNQGYPDQNPGPDSNQMNGPNPTQTTGNDFNQVNNQLPNQNGSPTDQVSGNTEAGNTYWEAQNAGQNPTLGQNTPRQEAPGQFYQNYQQQMGGGVSGPQMQQPIEPPKKKSRKGLIAAIIVIVLLISVAGTAFAFKDKILNTLSLSTKSPADYYASVEQQAINASIDKMMTKTTLYDYSKGMAYKMSAGLSYDKDTVSSLLQSTVGMTIEDLESYIGIPLDSIGFDMTVALKDSNLYEQIGLKLNQIDIITAEIFLDMVKEQLLIRLPELSPAYLSQSLGMDYYGIGEFDLEAYISQLEVFTSDKTTDFLKRYFKIITDNIKDVELNKNEELEVDNITVKCNMLTVTIDEETLLDIASAVLKEAKKDDYILSLLPMLNVSKDQYREAIKEAEAEIERALDDLTGDGGEVVMDVYVDNLGNIIGRNIHVEENGESIVSLGYALLSKGTQEEYEFYIEDDYGTTILSINGSHTKNNDMYTGEAIIDINADSEGYGSYSFDLEYEDVRSEVKDNQVYNYGKYTLSSLAMMGMEIGLKYDVVDNVQNMKLSLNMGRTPIVTLDLTAEYLKNFKFPTPSPNDEVYDALMESEYYLATMDIDKFVADLSAKLGVDLQSIIDYYLPFY